MNQGLIQASGEAFHSIIFVRIDMPGTSANTVLTASVTWLKFLKGSKWWCIVFSFHLVLCVSQMHQEKCWDAWFSAGDMQSHELVVKQNSVSQTSKVQRVKIKEGRGVYTECPWQTGWNPSSSRTTSGPLDSSRVQGPLWWCSSVSLPHALHSGCAGTCWFHLLTTTVVKLLSFIRSLIPQSPWPLHALDHYKMYKEKDWGGDERKEEEEGTTPPAWE